MASAARKTVEKTITEDVIALELTKEEAEELSNCTFVSLGLRAMRDQVRAALQAPAETDDRPIQVGDKVRVVEDAYDYNCAGYVGTVGRIDNDDPIGRYRIDFPDRDWVWAKTVERVND